MDLSLVMLTYNMNTCSLHIFIHLLIPTWFPGPPMALYASLVSVTYIRSILFNRTHSIGFVVLQNLSHMKSKP